MKKIITLILASLIIIPAFSQILLLDEDFGAAETFVATEANPPSTYDLDPAAEYLSTEGIVINYYGQGNTSEGKYEGASGGNFFLLSNNWNLSDVVLTWANMDVSSFSELTEIKFGCAFSGGANDAWTGNWLFSLQYSFDDVVNDPSNATWYNIDLLSKASGWPDTQTAGAGLWSLVSVDAGINLVNKDRLSVRIFSNGNYDYHFDDFRIYTKTPTGGMERTVIAKETFGPSGFYRGPASSYSAYSNGGNMLFNDYQVRYQNFDSFTNSYEGNSNDGNWFLTQQEFEGVREDTIVFSVNTLYYADVQLEFGFAYWGGVPGTMVGVRYTTDSINWYPLLTVNPEFKYPGTNEQTINDDFFNLIKYNDILPRAEKLSIKIYQATSAQMILDDICLTGVYSTLSTDVSLSGISFPGNEGLSLVPDFDPDIKSYTVLLPPGSVSAPEIEVTTGDEGAEYIVEDALDVRSEDEADRQSYIWVTAADGETNGYYTITFNVDHTGTGKFRAGNISVYPNPVQSILHLSAESPVGNLQIRDISGKGLLSVRDIHAQEFSLEVGMLKPGIYFLFAEMANGNTRVLKFVKE